MLAPLVAGRVPATPVNVGDFVQQGQIICELDHRDAQLRLDQARAQLDEAIAALRQTQSRIGWCATAISTLTKCRRPPPPAPTTSRPTRRAKLAAADAQALRESGGHRRCLA